MKKSLFVLGLGVLGATMVPAAHAQILLTNSGTYTENFNNLPTALPTGVQVYTGATATALGTASTYIATPGTTTAWADTTGAFKDFASADSGLLSTATTAQQTAATDRALGFRQTGAFGDPGASIVFTLANTTGYSSFTLGLELQMLSVQGRSTTLTLDYNIGGGTFTNIGTYPDPGVFGVTPFTFNFGTALDNQTSAVNIRVSALTASTGANSRDSIGVDNFSLTYTVPEPSTYAMMAGGLGLLLLGQRVRRRTARA